MIHLPFIDGLRALMALWVASGHAFMDLSGVVDHYRKNQSFCPEQFFKQGFYAHFAVDVFIVISGFCLMLPVARKPGFTLTGGWRGYLYRRARRILPPYYCAILASLALAALRWKLTTPNIDSWYTLHIDLLPSAFYAHIFLIQNMWDPWARAIDGPTWSVATECQIYLLFPLLILLLWRLFNPVIVIAWLSAVGVGLLFITFNGLRSGLSSCAWFAGLFAMGMFAAQWHVLSRNISYRWHFASASIVLLASTIIAINLFQWTCFLMCYVDFLVGAAAAFTLAYFSSFAHNEQRGLILELLEWKPLVAIGSFSYSLYLVHAPLLSFPQALLLKYNATPFVAAFVLGVTLLGVIFVSRWFYKYIELPCMIKK